MRILLVEDDDCKAATIVALVEETIGPEECELQRAKSVNGAFIKLDQHFDLVIVDLVLPQMDGSTDTVDATNQWCEVIENHLAGRTAAWIVMTSYADVAQTARHQFARYNVAVIEYNETDNWKPLLTQKVRDNYETRPLDFLLICALKKEREGYSKANCELGEMEVISGLDCQCAKIDELRGVIVVQPSVGMISAAITTAKALSLFRPRAVAMSGICGGRETETVLGALVVPKMSWNYQSGKFIDGALKHDLQQVPLPPVVSATLCQMTSETYSNELRQGLLHSELNGAPIQTEAMVSGSQVVADGSVAVLIGSQDRKAAAVDMEVASVYAATHDFFNGGGIYFAAKTVVDLANPHKDDRYHEYGCALSARFVINALRKLLIQT